MTAMTVRTAAAFVSLAVLAGGLAGAQAQDYVAIVAAPDRTDAERETDKKRNPEKMMAFTGVKTGMKVMDIVSSGGYSAELLARSVGPDGKVYAVNSPETAERAKERFEPRLARAKSLEPVVRGYAIRCRPMSAILTLSRSIFPTMT